MEIEKSIKFNNHSNSADDAQLYRTIGTTSNRKTYTHSFWAKRSKRIGGIVYGVTDNSGSYFHYFLFESSDKVTVNEYRYNESPSNKIRYRSNRYFRDLNSWYHFVVAIDTTQSTAGDRQKIYVNGERLDSFEISVNPDQNLDTYINSTSPYPVYRIGLAGWGYSGFNGQLAEFNFIDGQALDPTYFGFTESQTGIWKPKKYTGTYGTNGFHLEFKDPSNLGRDTSGNGNNFSQDNLTGTSNDHTNDSMPDTPTNNFIQLNDLDSYHQSGGAKGSQEAGFRAVCASASGTGNLYPFMQTFGGVRSGKYYAEFKSAGGQMAVGVCDRGKLDSDNTSNPYGAYSPQSFIYTDRGELRKNIGNVSGSFASYSVGDVIGVCMDADNHKVYFHKNGTYINGQDGSNQQNPETGFNGFNVVDLDSGNASYMAFHVGADGYQNPVTVDVNLGQRAFTHTKPTGYRHSNIKNFQITLLKQS